jgi:hypothetical protein
MSISDTVTVNVSVQDVTPSIAGFGTPLILAYHTRFLGVREYEASPAGLLALVADGFATTHAVYRKAAAIVSQTPHTDKFKVAPRAAANVQTVTLVPKWYTLGKPVSFDITVGTTTTHVSYTPIGTDTTIALVATGLYTAFGTVAGVTDSDTDGELTLVATVPEVRMYLSNIVGLDVADTSVDAGIAADLAAAALADNDWFGLVIDSNSSAEIALAAAYALANEKIFGALSTDATNFGSATGIAHTLQGTINHNTYVVATRDMLGSAEAGLMGRQFSRVPGSTTWAHKQIAGATPDGLTSTEFSNARANGAITYVNDGVVHTYDGFACSGRYLDITQGIAWLRARIREAVLIVLVNNEKIGFTNSGASLIEAAVAGVLAQGESNELLAPGWSVSRPDVSTVSAANKLGRIFPDMKFKAVLQGAIQKVVIDGTLTV